MDNFKNLERETVKSGVMKKVISKTDGLLSKLRIACKEKPKNYTHTNTIKIISDIDTLILAYELIKSKKSVNTKDNNDETLEKINFKWFQQVSKKLIDGKYKFSAVKRIIISNPTDKFSNKSLSIPIKEKIVQKAIDIVLKMIYEPTFSKFSHGHKPLKRNHSALKSVKKQFQCVNWVIEANLKTYFDKINHTILLNILKKKIQCEKTIALIRNFLRCDYILNGTKFSSKKGILQGSTISPILCRIYLNNLDIFLTEYAKNFEAKIITSIKKDISEYSGNDNLGYKRMYFIRHIDNFLIGICGKFSDAVKIKSDLKFFLQKKLKIELNETKTKITKFSDNKVFFLGFFIHRNYKKEKKIKTSIHNRKSLVARIIPVSFHAPIKKLYKKLLQKKFVRSKNHRLVPTAVKKIITSDHADIIIFYNQKIRGVLNYYSFADNHKSLRSIVHMLKLSAARTLALKYKEKAIRPIFKKFGSLLQCPYTKIKLYIPTSFKKT